MSSEQDGAIAGADEGMSAEEGCDFGGVINDIEGMKQGRFPGRKGV
jgi:hypothetical protein